MKWAIAAVFLLAVCFAGLNAQCPDPSLLKDANGTKLCARLFETSHYYNEQSCGGRTLDAYPGDDSPTLPFVWNNRVSALVVARQCSLTVWSRGKKKGKRKTFSAGIQYRLKDVNQGLFGDWDNDISGYFCEWRRSHASPVPSPAMAAWSFHTTATPFSTLHATEQHTFDKSSSLPCSPT
ncbi:hypothetical protein JZ751_013514 [Albula glossodonta]|uniref:Syncollin n=1 Tax=Albula glossodonta TaxID=121402 RepID=A0A8T2N0Y4_9TELE|nr:hypothetical protein JZ751_013514 [Albula glossodonta]